MKKIIFMMTLLMSMSLIGCSSDEPVIDNGGNGELGDPQFLTVNLVTNSTNSSRSSRATGDPNNAEYEEGLEAENKVTKVRFYFFDKDGHPAAVRSDGTNLKNWLEWTDISEEDKDMPNVEKILSATLIIQSPKGDVKPAQVVAIINPSEEAPSEERSVTGLFNIAHNYQTCNTSGNFVMSNSTYAKDQVIQMAVSVDGKIKKTSAEALNDPVQIYVERTIAKVRLNSSLTPISTESNIYKTSTDTKEQKVKVNGTDTEIYVKFLGWNTTAVADKSRLVKLISATWPTDLFGNTSTPWNWSDYHRSYWAVNPSGVAYQYGAFVPNTDNKTIANNIFQAQAKTKFDKSEWVYINENATSYSNLATGADPATPTKVIIAAQLVDKDGNPLEFAEYGSTRTTIEGLKLLFANNCGLYKKVTTATEAGGSETKFTKIEPSDLTIKTATELGVAGKDAPGRYKVYVQLAKDEEDKWYASNNENATAISAKEANQQLKSLGSAKVWKDGYTYYYFDIKHLGNKIGVVRNHIYDANITKLSGLGTPVYNPDEIIYPEKPKDDEETFIAAQINILSWRIVSNDYELDW